MYEHLVAFKFREPLEQDKERQLLDALHGLKEAVPGIVELTAGTNQTPETDNIQGYTLGLRVTFTDRQALLNYGPHPAHQAFVRLLDGLLDNVIVVDYPADGVQKRG